MQTAAHGPIDEASMDEPLTLFDAHLDLAYLELNRRGMLKPLDRLSEDERQPHPPASVTLPELAAANVRFALATVYTAPGSAEQIDGPDDLAPELFDPNDVESAHEAGVDQLNVYQRWAEQGVCSIATHGSFSATETTASAAAAREQGLDGAAAPVLELGVLVENADPIRTPDELPFWIEQGVVAISLTWAKQGRYAAGNSVPSGGGNPGLTALGIAMLEAMQEERLVLDVSHLNDASLAVAFERFNGRVIASHSNCRALVASDDPVRDQRHLTDETIREIGRRDGVIGLNLAAYMIARGAGPENRPTIEQAVAHVSRVCELTGSTRHVGLGSDLDGGFSARALPRGIDRARDMQKLVGALRAAGFTEADLRAFASENWLRVFAEAR